MSLDAIICDWNGTITRDRDERPLLESIALDVFLASLPFHPRRAVRILKTRRTLEALHRDKRRTALFDFVTQMYCIYNERVIRGMPVEHILASADRYAGKKETQEKLDRRILRSVDGCHRRGNVTGILSGGYKYGIDRALTRAGYGRTFDFCHANPLKQEAGRAVGIDLTIYRNKSEWLLKLLEFLDIDGSRVVYIGDSDIDEGCFEIAGYPVVAFQASDEAKQLYSQRYAAFVPADETDLLGYLESI
jgi:phosphoglycolate phosphatase-like HAD superfamily hydrolase